MRLGLSNSERRGTTLVEFSVVCSFTMCLIFMMVVGAMAVFRFQEVAHLAREGTRYAATHAGQYDLDGNPASTGIPAVATSDDMRAYLLTKAKLLDPSKLTVTISYSAPAAYSPRNMPSYDDTNPALVPPGQITIFNYVTVTVTYQLYPEMFLTGPYTLTSTSTLPVAY